MATMIAPMTPKTVTRRTSVRISMVGLCSANSPSRLSSFGTRYPASKVPRPNMSGVLRHCGRSYQKNPTWGCNTIYVATHQRSDHVGDEFLAAVGVSGQVVIAERSTPFELYAELAVYYLVTLLSAHVGPCETAAGGLQPSHAQVSAVHHLRRGLGKPGRAAPIVPTHRPWWCGQHPPRLPTAPDPAPAVPGRRSGCCTAPASRQPHRAPQRTTRDGSDANGGS